VIAKERLEAEPGEDALKDRQCGNAAGGQGPCGGPRGCATGMLRISLVVRSARLVPHGSLPRTSHSASESGDPSAAISADMVVREEERSREKISTKYLCRYALTQVGRHSTYVKAFDVSRETVTASGDLDIALA
jgi:hypothetical protein